MTVKITESRVVELFREHAAGRKDLVTEEGEPLRIVYPGRPNDNRGADLCDAVIATASGVVRGEVEVHVRSSGWRQHLHHCDPYYNRVVLHVALIGDSDSFISLQDGRRVPTLVLGKFIGKTGGVQDAGDMGGPMPCYGAGKLYGERTASVLDRAGEIRFRERFDDFLRRLTTTEPGQLLYEGIMAALGYSKNKRQMAGLSRLVPLAVLEKAVTADTPEEECLVRYQSRLLGAAGLLPSQRGMMSEDKDSNGWIKRLERGFTGSGMTRGMPCGEWSFFKIRPGNHPVRRLAAMSYLLLRHRREGLLAGILRCLEETPLEGGSRMLEKSLEVSADGYWKRYLDFGRFVENGPALVGKGRAADIVINMLLPFAAALGNEINRAELASKAMEIYRKYPPAPGNTLIRHMAGQLGLKRGELDSARRQQGLIHLFKTLCSQGKCRECPLALESRRER